VTVVKALWAPLRLRSTSLRTHLPQLRKLDLPAVLEMFHPGRPDTCFVALVHLEDDTAVVATGDGELRVSVAELDRLWTRNAVLFWPLDDIVGAEAGGDDQAMRSWARAALTRQGYLDDGADLSSAVSRFQRQANLVPDGVIGRRTLMALYSLDPRSRPRLSGSGSPVATAVEGDS
jgi:hypothetical protein